MNKDDVIGTEKILSYDNEKDDLLRQVKILEDEKKFVESELKRLQREIERLRKEISRMKTPPLLVGSVDDILSDKRAIIKSSTGPIFIVNTADHVSDKKLKIGSKVALNKQTLSIVGILPESYDASIAATEVIEKPTITYKDIGGLSQQIEEITESVEMPLLKPELFKKVGIKPPKGVLLIGPPGTGKTLLAKAVAHNTNATFIRIVGSELVRKYIGEGAKLVRELFDLARKKGNSIIFIDELDAIGARRIDVATSGDREVQRTLMQLLAEMDGFEALDDVKIIAATNRHDILDEALLRPGRFDRIIEIPYPDKKGRKEIFKIHIKEMNVKDIDIDILSKKTDKLAGADIQAICMEAGIFAIRDERDHITQKDFEKAVEKILHTDTLRKENVETRMFG